MVLEPRDANGSIVPMDKAASLQNISQMEFPNGRIQSGLELPFVNRALGSGLNPGIAAMGPAIFSYAYQNQTGQLSSFGMMETGVPGMTYTTANSAPPPPPTLNTSTGANNDSFVPKLKGASGSSSKMATSFTPDGSVAASAAAAAAATTTMDALVAMEAIDGNGNFALIGDDEEASSLSPPSSSSASCSSLPSSSNIVKPSLNYLGSSQLSSGEAEALANRFRRKRPSSSDEAQQKPAKAPVRIAANPMAQMPLPFYPGVHVESVQNFMSGAGVMLGVPSLLSGFSGAIPGGMSASIPLNSTVIHGSGSTSNIFAAPTAHRSFSTLDVSISKTIPQVKMDISSASDHTTFPEPLFSPHGLLDSTTPSGKGAFAVQPAKKSAGAENTMPKISHRSHAPTDKRRKLKVLSAADNEFLLENVPSYVDTVSNYSIYAAIFVISPRLDWHLYLRAK